MSELERIAPRLGKAWREEREYQHWLREARARGAVPAWALYEEMKRGLRAYRRAVVREHNRRHTYDLSV